MSIKGFIVNLSSGSYETPDCCSSCMGPRQTEVKARYSEKTGNVTTVVSMAFPYCDGCAKRARWEKVLHFLDGAVAAVAGVGLAVAAWRVDVGMGAPIRFAVALPLGVALTALVALVLRPSLPAPPATARGEAVMLRDTHGSVLCTNPEFAQLLAQANRATAKPGVYRMTAEVWAPLMALFFGVIVLISWIQVGAPERTAAAAPSTSASAPSTAVPSASTTVSAAAKAASAPGPTASPLPQARKPAPAPPSGRKR